MVAVTALIIGSVLTGIYLPERDVKEYNVVMEVDGQLVKEKITIDFEYNVEIFHNTTAKGNVILDYDRGLVVSLSDDSDACYVSPILDKVKQDSPEVLASTLEDAVDTIFHPEVQWFILTVNSEPIRDRSVLGIPINNHCGDKLVFWAYPKCENGDGVAAVPQHGNRVARWPKIEVKVIIVISI
ncbi:uncharacterized protein LOC144441898 [Glandiceps talaboti]